jgi:phenylalanyl-tRNA synthetase beta chain
MLALGWNEAVSSTFCSATDAVTFAPQPDSAVKIGNPLSEEAGMLRPSLIPGMLTMLAGNLNRDAKTSLSSNSAQPSRDLPTKSKNAHRLPSEQPARPARRAHSSSRSPSISTLLKGTVEELLAKFSARSKYIDAFPIDSGLLPQWLHPGRAARAVVDGLTVGYFGQLHPTEASAASSSSRSSSANSISTASTAIAPPTRSPRTLALPGRPPRLLVRLPDAVKWAEIATALESLAIPEIASFEPKR